MSEENKEKTSEAKKISEEEKTPEEEKVSEEEKVEEKDKEPEKIPEKVFDDDDTKIIEYLNEKSWTEKILSPFESLRDLFEEVSWKFIAAVSGGILFCIFVIGAVLIFADGTSEPIKIISDTISENEESVEGKKVHIKIRAGMSTSEIADQLAEKNVISSSLKFRLISRLRGYDDQMKPGTYTFVTGMEDEEVFQKILNGEKHVVTFTIPEGFGVKEIANRLYELDIVDKEDFLQAAENFAPYDYMKKHKNVFYSAEGFLFPDTYTIESDYSIEEILDLMADNFDNRLTKEMREKAEEKNLSIYDLIILASIVEKEVRYPEDRAIVAQVFFKRLQLNMPLQTDATLQYLMDAPKEDVTFKDTEIDSPYNTYQYAGLPPGPIANPGLESIEAVLNPADTNYLYFVADRQGHNHYADTYDEHLELVSQYR